MAIVFALTTFEAIDNPPSTTKHNVALIGGDTSLILSPDSDFFKFFGKSGLAKKN